MLDRSIIYISGLPNSGMLLLNQILGQHSDIYTTAQTSPLCGAVMAIRQQLSGDQFLINQLGQNFDLVYQRLLQANRGFINGWYAKTDKPWVVDQNPNWLGHLETLHSLDPNFRMFICVRELGQVLGEIENQHQKTLLLDFPEHLAHLSHRDRANHLLSETGIIGVPLRSLQNIQDVDLAIQQHLYYIVFEHLIANPQQVLTGILQWLGLPNLELNLDLLKNLPAPYSQPKYPTDDQRDLLTQLPTYTISPSLDQTLKKNYPWFYRTFYPAQL